MADHTLGDSHFLHLSDGRKLHYQTQGVGGPTVVFEAGMGFSSAVWGLVQPAVGEYTTVVAYDRAGAGKSYWDSSDRTIDRMCDDLEQLLNRLPGPFLLVGHSWGGPIIRRMAARRTANICGLVLVDQSDERNADYFTKAATRWTRLGKTLVLWMMHTMGLGRAGCNIVKHMPQDCRREILCRDISIRGVKLNYAERKHFLPGLDLMLDADDRLEGIDVTVMTGTAPKGSERMFRAELVQAHRKTAAALDQGTLVEAPRSGHYILMTDPELVVEEIVKMVEKCREGLIGDQQSNGEAYASPFSLRGRGERI